jgi:hypothetical protein
MEIASIVASFVSLVLAGVAIWLSLYFYTQGKNTETRVQVALEGIKAQTDALQAINARTLDRLTKYVTTPRDDASQTVQVLYATIRELPDIVLKLRPPTSQSNEEGLRQGLMNAYIALWNYAGTANIWASFSLPPADRFNPADAFDRLVQSIVDRSASDFHFLTSLIDQIPTDEIRKSPYLSLYQEAHTQFRNLVTDTANHFARRAQQQSPTT